MSDPTTVPEVLVAAADHMQQYGWIQHGYCANVGNPRACSVCPRGAIAVVVAGNPLYAVDWPKHRESTDDPGADSSVFDAERANLALIAATEKALADYLIAEGITPSLGPARASSSSTGRTGRTGRCRRSSAPCAPPPKGGAPMAKPSPHERREWELYFESLGLATVPDTADTAHVLSVVREQRRRYAHRDDQQALATLAAAMTAQVREDLPDIPAGDMAAVLVYAASMLSGIAAHEVSGTNVVNIVALMADDLAQIAERGRTGG